MALVRNCVLCKKTAIIRNKEFGICCNCVNEIIKAERQRKRRMASDKKRDLIRFD
jgi:predicted nucleic acid-binding Zn ribbon protein